MRGTAPSIEQVELATDGEFGYGCRDLIQAAQSPRFEDHVSSSRPQDSMGDGITSSQILSASVQGNLLVQQMFVAMLMVNIVGWPHT